MGIPKGRFKHTEESRAKISAGIRKAIAEGRFPMGTYGVEHRWTPEKARALRKAQIAHEEAEANRLRAKGYEVFSPTVVCDRIAIKDGKVFFVEFKQPGQRLRDAQRRLRDTEPDRYLVFYCDP